MRVQWRRGPTASAAPAATRRERGVMCLTDVRWSDVAISRAALPRTVIPGTPIGNEAGAVQPPATGRRPAPQRPTRQPRAARAMRMHVLIT
jgi:hypothetical protein